MESSSDKDLFTNQNNSGACSEESEEEVNMKSHQKTPKRKRGILMSESDEEVPFKDEKPDNSLFMEHSAEGQDRSSSTDSEKSEEDEASITKSNQKTPKRKRKRLASESDEEVSSKSKKPDNSSVLEHSVKIQNSNGSLDTSLKETEEETHVKKSSQKTPKGKELNIDSNDSAEQDSDSGCESKEVANRQNESSFDSDNKDVAFNKKNRYSQENQTPVFGKKEDDSSDSSQSLSSEDEESLSKIKLKKLKCSDDELKRENEGMSEENESEPFSKKQLGKAKHLKISSDSDKSLSSEDEEPLSKILKESNKSKDGKLKRKSKSVAEQDISKPLFKNQQGKTKESKTHKVSSKVNCRIEHLKKYIRTAGIHVQSYTKLFENCKSGKAQAEKLLELLHKEGLKGQPTLQKCKKLRKKIEKRKEVAELDIKNIIVSEGRPRRGRQNEQLERVQGLKEEQIDNKFSRILDIIDSEESD